MRLRPFRRVQSTRSGTIWAAVLALCAIRGEAATWTWVDGTSSWSTGANWSPNTVPLSGASTSLVFGGTGATAYTATHDLGASFDLNRLILQSSATVSETLAATTGNTLEFHNDGTALTSILQNGSGPFSIDVGIEAKDQLQLGGSGAGLVTLSAIVGGNGGLNFVAGNWRISNDGNSFKGGVTVGTGAHLELRSATGPTRLNRSATEGLLGADIQNGVIINGGTIKVSTNGTTSSGGYVDFGNFTLEFGAAGGVFDIANSNPSQPNAHAGTIGVSSADNGGDIDLKLHNSALAVVRFNGGQLGLSNYGAPQGGDWSVNQNALRVSSYEGDGPVRFELTNGALAQAGTYVVGNPAPAITKSIDAPTTYRGVLGGDPTSGSAGLENAGTKLDMGRLAVNRSELTYSSGLRLEYSLQVATASASSRLAGGITLAGSDSGHPAYVTFSGRATSNPLTTAILAPLVGGEGQNLSMAW